MADAQTVNFDRRHAFLARNPLRTRNPRGTVRLGPWDADVVHAPNNNLSRSSISLVLRPALADKQGRALFIGTPRGHNHFYDLYEAAHSQPDWAAFQYTTEQGGAGPYTASRPPWPVKLELIIDRLRVRSRAY